MTLSGISATRARRTGTRIVWAVMGIAALIAVMGAVEACGVGSDDHPSATAPSAAPRPLPMENTSTSTASALPNVTPDLTSDFAELQNGLDAAIAVVITPVGGAGAPLILGEWDSGPAWSTIKVPLVIAALREAEPPQVTDEMTAAITRSDNAAAEAIWAGLGDPVTAAHKVEAILREAGDLTTVQSQKIRPEFTAFGQTDWSLTDQARFMSVAACDSRNAPVLELMGQVQQDQSWGIGKIPGTRFKGGWGPSITGEYLERQVGLIATPTGISAVAVAAEPDSGSYDDGVATLTVVGQWLLDRIAVLPSGQCGS